MTSSWQGLAVVLVFRHLYDHAFLLVIEPPPNRRAVVRPENFPPCFTRAPAEHRASRTYLVSQGRKSSHPVNRTSLRLRLSGRSDCCAWSLFRCFPALPMVASLSPPASSPSPVRPPCPLGHGGSSDSSPRYARSCWLIFTTTPCVFPAEMVYCV